MSYVPQPSTIAARVLAWFKDQAPDIEVTTGVLAEAMGQPMASVITSLEPAFEHGLIAREKREGRLYWSVSPSRMRPLGSPPPVTADDDDVDRLPVRQRTVPAATAGGVSLLDRPAWAPPKESTMSNPVTPPPVEEVACRCPRVRPAGHRAEKGQGAPSEHARRGCEVALPGADRAYAAGRLRRPASDRGQEPDLRGEEGQREAGQSRPQRGSHRRLASLT